MPIGWIIFLDIGIYVGIPELKLIGSILANTQFQIDQQETEIFRYILYLAPKIPGIFAEKLDRNVSVYRRWEPDHNVYLPKRLRKLKTVNSSR